MQQMENRVSNLLDEALGINQQTETWTLKGKVVAVEDCVEISGSFVLHHLLKRNLSPHSPNVTIFIAFSHPFSHYDRILRKLGCNLVVQREHGRFIFFDMSNWRCPGGSEGITGEGGLIELYAKIVNIVNALPVEKKNCVNIVIDDVSLMEVAGNGCSDHVLDFLHYCHALTSEFDCSLVILNHADVYSCLERPTFLLNMEYLADVLIKAEPLATGLAADVHGQLTILNRGIDNGNWSSKNRISNFHFKIKENSVEYFYPGERRL